MTTPFALAGSPHCLLSRSVNIKEAARGAPPALPGAHSQRLRSEADPSARSFTGDYPAGGNRQQAARPGESVLSEAFPRDCVEQPARGTYLGSAALLRARLGP